MWSLTQNENVLVIYSPLGIQNEGKFLSTVEYSVY